jgi:hypothetical protein
MPKVILIPGTTTIERVMENEFEADLIEDEKKEIDLIWLAVKRLVKDATPLA